MAKRGRPKSLEKTKTKTIKLSLKANAIYRKIRNSRKNFNFSRYVSECLVNDFGTAKGQSEYMRRQIGKKNMEIDKLREEIENLIEKRKKVLGENTIQEKRLKNEQ